MISMKLTLIEDHITLLYLFKMASARLRSRLAWYQLSLDGDVPETFLEGRIGRGGSTPVGMGSINNNKQLINGIKYVLPLLLWLHS